ncbi:MAG: hypothetical protein Q7K34_04135 [archaeon]|nr:hypothetical protein [archaeon]
MSNEQKHFRDKVLSDRVTKTKVAHGKKELDVELQRLKVLKEIDKSTVGEEINLPDELRNWQQVIVIIGTLNLKSSGEVMLACKKLKYSGKITKGGVKNILLTRRKEYFKFDKAKGWLRTNKGQNEFSRLKQFI